MAEVLEPAGRGVASFAGEAASLSSVLGEVLEPLDGGVTSMAGKATSTAGKAASIAQFRIFVTTVYFLLEPSQVFATIDFLGLLEPAPNFVIFATTDILVRWSELQFFATTGIF